MVFEFWEKINDIDNLIGVSKVSLHQFYVAFRNPVITKYLNRNKLPVIGCDGWESICNPLNGEVYGQAQILVALGADKQIHNLKIERGFDKEPVIAKLSYLSPNIEGKKQVNVNINARSKHLTTLGKQEGTKKDESRHIRHIEIVPKKSPQKHQVRKVVTKNIATQSDTNMGDSLNNARTNFNSDALGAFLEQLVQQKHKQYVENSTNTENQQNILPNVSTDINIDNPKIRKTSDLLDSLQQALSIKTSPLKNLSTNTSNGSKTFKTHIVVENALHLPSRKKCKAKTSKGKIFREEMLPSTYVSFEADSDLKVTQVVRDTKNPEWDYRCDVDLSADLLIDNQKRLIFKIWKKLTTLSHTEPNLETDTIIGFAALDLTVLLAGMPTVSGWFNIMDFSNKCNGQIKISVTPLENLNKFNDNKVASTLLLTNPPPVNFCQVNQEFQCDKVEEPSELLSRALKRKFTELDEITQRLKLRLSNVTNEESDGSNDDFADAFEKDINTLCVEDDYDMINFEDKGPQIQTQEAGGALLQIQSTNFIYKNNDDMSEVSLVSYGNSEDSLKDPIEDNTKKGNRNECRDNSAKAQSSHEEFSKQSLSNAYTPNVLDKQLLEGRQKIDSLLEKLSLLSHNENEIFGNRYVSGCSTKQDCSNSTSDDILTDIRKDAISTDTSTNNSLTNILIPCKQTFNALSASSSSNSGLLTQYSEVRLVPEGAGNPPDDKIKNVDSTSSNDT